jgi:hypothetical protein
MQDTSKHQHLAALVERLKEHIARVGNSPPFERALAEAEAELRAIEQRKEQPPQ